MSLKALNFEYQEEPRPYEREAQGNKIRSTLKRLSDNTVGALRQRRAYPKEGRLEEILLDLEFEQG